MLIKIILNIALKPILWITNAHNIHQVGYWKPCNQLMNESLYCNCKIKDKQKTKKILKPNSKQNANKQTTQKYNDTRRMVGKKLKQDDFSSSTKLVKTF
jgi:valyl-tRNA synthetase